MFADQALSLTPHRAERAAQDLAAELARYNIPSDVHLIWPDRAQVSVYFGLLVHTDGHRFWWITHTTTAERERPLWTYADDVAPAARRLADCYRDLRALPVEELMLGGAPLLGDVLLENFDAAPV
ncbi:hypothetical protein [Streptosporangium sp. NPDC048865]|uniref:hypothetical protein n=1 Tax=Streptosporangium sp. NPDC048865 TaxID=3155766 RepID=UPI0034331C8F